MDFITLFYVATAFVLSAILLGYSSNWKNKRYPNGPWGIPLVGNLPFFGKYPPSTFKKWQARFGNVFSIRLGSWNTVVLNGYEAIKEAAENQGDTFSDRPGFLSTHLMKEVYGTDPMAFGKFSRTYIHHRKLTSVVLRAFCKKTKSGMADLILGETTRFVNEIIKNGVVTPTTVKYTIARIVLQFLYGSADKEKVETRLDSVIIMVDDFNELAGNGNVFDVLPWLRHLMPRSVNAVREMLLASYTLRDPFIKEHMDTYTASTVRDVTDLLIHNGKGNCVYGHEGQCPRFECLHAMVGDLQAAGFDTTNRMIQWLLLYMAAFPNVQERVQNEIDEVVGDTRSLEMIDRKRLVFTDATIHEVLRCVPNAPFSVPHFTTENTKIDGFDIDKGTVVIFNLHSVMHEKSFWGDPETFRPSRLIDESGKLDNKKCNHIIPFGMGRRKCVGEEVARMKMFLMFTTIMQRCSISVPTGKNVDLQPKPGLVYYPKPFSLVVNER